MAIDNISQIGAIGGIQKTDPVAGGTKASSVDGKQYPSFKDTLSGFLGDVNELQKKADVSIEKMSTGEITDVHQVMSSVNEANLAFNMMMEIRNKVMDAYSQVMSMRL